MSPRSSPIVHGSWKGNDVRFHAKRVIVSVRAASNLDGPIDRVLREIVSEIGDAKVIIRRRGRPWAVIQIDGLQNAAVDIPTIAEAVARRPDVRYAEPDFLGEARATPTDKYYSDQNWTAKTEIENAWNVTTGSSDVLLAVLDSGIAISGNGMDPDHPDLQGARFIVRHNDAGGVPVHHDYVGNDDAEAGLPDDVPEDRHGHGTHITGILAAPADGLEGVAGVNWASSVYIARVLNKSKQVWVSHVITAVADAYDYAVAADKPMVINMSFGFEEPANLEIAALLEMCQETKTGNVLMCIACGLRVVGGTRSHDEVDWPAAFAASFDHVVAVAAVDANDTLIDPDLDDFTPVTITAPGNAITSAIPHYDCVGVDGSWDPNAARAGDPYGAMSGSSMAAPVVAGVASLMWSVNPKLTAADIKRCLISSADAVSGGTLLRVNAANAVDSVKPIVNLETPQIDFVDVVIGESAVERVLFYIESCAGLDFEVVSGAEQLDPGYTITVRSASHIPGSAAGSHIEVTYTGTEAGEVAFGRFDVRCPQLNLTWTVRLCANTTSDARAAVVLVADKSGSMMGDSGISGATRMDVLRECAGILIDTMRTGDGLGIVAFDGDASTVAAIQDFATDVPGSAVHAALAAALNGLAPGGSTSIGDGVALANTNVAAAAQSHRALLVLTDGHENTAELIETVLPEISVPVYAVGMGTASVIMPDTLEALTDSSGGYLTLTGDLDDERRYEVAKYFVQMLAGVYGAGVLVDPSGRIQAGAGIDVPFRISDEERACTVACMIDAESKPALDLVTPDGTLIAFASEAEGVRFVTGRRVVLARMKFPVMLRSGARHYSGAWTARLRCEKSGSRSRPREHRGEPYSVIITADSNVLVTSRVVRSALASGSVRVRTWIRDRRVFADRGASVRALIRSPDGVLRRVGAQRVSPGVFEAEFDARLVGDYGVRVRVRGLTRAGERFVREEALTAHVWRAGPRAGNAARDREAARRPR